MFDLINPSDGLKKMYIEFREWEIIIINTWFVLRSCHHLSNLLLVLDQSIERHNIAFCWSFAWISDNNKKQDRKLKKKKKRKREEETHVHTCAHVKYKKKGKKKRFKWLVTRLYINRKENENG